jgi:glycosyltransferase involved in cell wall biosynthesis
LFDHVRESGGNPEKITWIPNGADLSRFEGYDHYSGGSCPLVVMYVGGFGQAHDVITIVRAASILKQRSEHGFRFVIIGNGPKKAECVEEAKRLGLDNVEFCNPVPKSDVPRIQTSADILVASVLDSPIYRFGLNLNKMYDYFASARPVIFSGKSINDPVVEAGAGFSVLPEDPLAMVEAFLKIKKMTPQERVEMGKRGREYVEREFDMSVLGKKMEQMLIDAVRKKRGYK